MSLGSSTFRAWLAARELCSSPEPASNLAQPGPAPAETASVLLRREDPSCNVRGFHRPGAGDPSLGRARRGAPVGPIGSPGLRRTGPSSSGSPGAKAGRPVASGPRVHADQGPGLAKHAGLGREPPFMDLKLPFIGSALSDVEGGGSDHKPLSAITPRGGATKTKLHVPTDDTFLQGRRLARPGGPDWAVRPGPLVPAPCSARASRHWAPARAATSLLEMRLKRRSPRRWRGRGLRVVWHERAEIGVAVLPRSFKLVAGAGFEPAAFRL